MIYVPHIAKQCIQHAFQSSGGLVRLFASLTIILYIFFALQELQKSFAAILEDLKITMYFKKQG